MIEQRSEAWFAQRRDRVTGSVAGAILGLNPYRTPEDVMRAMVRDHHGAESEFSGNVATEYGVFHEPGGTVEYTMETGNAVEECGFFEYKDWLGASPDGLIGTNKVLEIKCPYGQRNKNPPQFKTLMEQMHYYAQTQIEMFCSEREELDFFQWSPYGTSLEEHKISKKWLDENIPELKRFHKLFLKEIKNKDHLLPKRVILNTLEAERLTQEYEEMCDAEDRAKARKADILQELVLLAGQRNADVCGKNLTLVSKKGSVSYAKAIAALAPDADLTPYTGKPTEYWLFK